MSLENCEIKAIKLLFSFILLAVIVSYIPFLAGEITINAMLGFALGLIYVKDRRGRYHYSWDGKYVTSCEGICLKSFLPLLGIVIPASITVMLLPMYAIEQLLLATFGSEIIGIFGGSWLS